MQQRTGRRRFLCLAGGAAGAGMAAWLGRGLLSPGSDLPRAHLPAADRLVTRSAWALGTEVSMSVYHADRARAESALSAAFAELELVEDLMSIYRPESQLSRLNREGRLAGAHPYLIEVLSQARGMSQRSEGAFDITVQPLWQLYAAAHRQGTLPDADQVMRVRRQIDWRRVEVSGGRVRLATRGARVTLNGIAQGYAADRVVAALRARGVERALVDVGELGTLGGKPGGDPWRVGIQHPRVEDAYVSLAGLRGRCLATSGDYATAFSADRKYNHLFDPRSGRSPAELASVSVAARTASQADALSTAVFVMGPDAGLRLVRSTPAADALLVLKDGAALVTDGFPLV